MDFQKIRDARKAAGITQDELAKRLGVNRATVSKYETGAIDFPASQLQRIADALGIHVLDLIGLSQQFENYDIKIATPSGDSVVDNIKNQYDLLSDKNRTELLVKIGVIPEANKNSPSTAEAAPGEDRISLEESNRLLAALGLIEEGQDLSDDDLAFLEHIVGLLAAWFGKRK